MENYRFKITIKEADQGGYHRVKKKVHNILNEQYPGARLRVSHGHAILENVIVGDKNKTQIQSDLKFIFENALPKWSKGVVLDDITESRKDLQPALRNSIKGLSDSLQATVEQLSQELATALANDKQSTEDYLELHEKYKKLEENYFALEDEKSKLEGIVKRYQNERKDLEDYKEENQGLKRKLKQLELIIQSPIKEKSGIEKKSDYIRKAIENGNHTIGEIWNYLVSENIDLNRGYLPELLKEGLKNNKFKKLKRGYYDL